MRGVRHTPSISSGTLPPLCLRFRHPASGLCPNWLLQWPHRVSAYRNVQLGAPVTARPSRSRQKQNVDPRKLHWFTSNVSIAHLTDHTGWNGEAYPCPVVSISWHQVSCTLRNQHFHFWFRPFAGKTAVSSKPTGECSHLVHFGYCHYVIKYLMRDIMNYHCSRVLRSRVRMIGKNSPGFSVFRVHGCSDPEHLRGDPLLLTKLT